MERPKIIHALYAGLGGHANVVFPLLESDFGKAFDHHLVFYGVEETVEAYKAKCRQLKIPYTEIIKKPKRYLKAFDQFKTILSENNPNAIIIHNSELIIPGIKYLKKQLKCKLFYVEHQDNNTKSLILKRMSKIALKKATGVICLSDAYKRSLLANFKVKVPVHVIPNAVDTSKFQPQKKEKKNLIGMASRMMPTKDHETLLHAFKAVLKTHPNAKLEIAGEGETLIATKSLANNLEISDVVHFSGLLNEEEMIDFYQRIDLFVLATKSETMSTAILQAMACSLPVITSSIENNAAIIENNETGWLYTDGNAVDLTDKIRLVLNNESLAAKVAANARTEILANYSIEKMATQYRDLLLK